MADTLSPTMTLRDFENGYWNLDQLKNFAERIGVPSAKKLDVSKDYASWVKARGKRKGKSRYPGCYGIGLKRSDVST